MLHQGTFPLAVVLLMCCNMCKNPLTMSWTAEIGFWRSVRPHQCWESWSVQSATDLYFRSFTDDSPENETNLDLNPRLNKPFLFINSEGGVVRKVVVPHDHQLAVSLGDCFLYFGCVYLVFGNMCFVCCCCPLPTVGREDEVNFCHKKVLKPMKTNLVLE